MGYVRVKARKWPARQDETVRNEFKKEMQIIRIKPKIDLWLGDEAGFEGDPQPRRIICRRGEKPRINYFGSHIMTSVLGAVRPRDGKFISLMMPYVDTDIFQYFISELNQAVELGKRTILVLDRAKWHLTKRLEWGIIEPCYLPAYSPDFNPIEELWLAIKREFFSWFWTDDHDALDDHLEKALKHYINSPDLVKSICSMRTFD